MSNRFVFKFWFLKIGFSTGLAIVFKEKLFVVFNFALGYGPLDGYYKIKGFYFHLNYPQMSEAGFELGGINIVKPVKTLE